MFIRRILLLLLIVVITITVCCNIERIKEEEVIMINGYEAVDLGLPSGLKWATCNIGANIPEECGDYFAWGETKTKEHYIAENCSTMCEDLCDIGNDARYDAATAIWGDGWRMPNRGDIVELRKNCIWELLEQNGMKGYKVTGINGNSIFLPFAGFYYSSELKKCSESGFYWLSNQSDINSERCLLLVHSELCCPINGCYYTFDSRKYFGRPIRPVSE